MPSGRGSWPTLAAPRPLVNVYRARHFARLPEHRGAAHALCLSRHLDHRRSHRHIRLKASDGFTKLWPSVVVVVGYGVAFHFLALTLKTIPIGVAYAIWAGAGISHRRHRRLGAVRPEAGCPRHHRHGAHRRRRRRDAGLLEDCSATRPLRLASTAPLPIMAMPTPIPKAQRLAKERHAQHRDHHNAQLVHRRHLRRLPQRQRPIITEPRRPRRQSRQAPETPAYCDGSCVQRLRHARGR